MEKEKITKLTLEINAVDVITSKYLDATDCAITRALKRAGRPDLIDVGQGIRNEEWTKRFESYNIKGYKEMTKHVQGMYKAKDKRRTDWKDKVFTLEFDESVYSNPYFLPTPQWFAKLLKRFRIKK